MNPRQLLLALAGGLDPESIRVTPMAGDNMLAAMQTRAIDGLSTVLPWTRKGVVEGSTVLVASGAEGDPPHLTPLAFNVLATKPDTCEKRKSLCVKMGRAFAEAKIRPAANWSRARWAICSARTSRASPSSAALIFAIMFTALPSCCPIA